MCVVSCFLAGSVYGRRAVGRGWSMWSAAAASVSQVSVISWRPPTALTLVGPLKTAVEPQATTTSAGTAVANSAILREKEDRIVSSPGLLVAVVMSVPAAVFGFRAGFGRGAGSRGWRPLLGAR